MANRRSEDRPKRLYIPVGIKRPIIAAQKVCPCGCGLVLTLHLPTHWDHEPALRLRDINTAGTDYIPPQLDPRYLVGRCVRSHKAKTSGTGATTAGTDTGKMKKERKRNKPPKRKYQWASRKIQGAGFKKTSRKIPSRKMRT